MLSKATLQRLANPVMPSSPAFPPVADLHTLRGDLAGMEHYSCELELLASMLSAEANRLAVVGAQMRSVGHRIAADAFERLATQSGVAASQLITLAMTQKDVPAQAAVEGMAA